MVRHRLLACILAALVVVAARAPAQTGPTIRIVSASGGSASTDGSTSTFTVVGQPMIGINAEPGITIGKWGFLSTLGSDEVSNTPWSPLGDRSAGIHMMTTPNPARDILYVTLQLPYALSATLVVHDVDGREVIRRVVESMTPGMRTITLDVEGLASGTYLLRLQAGTIDAVTRIVVLH